MTRKLAPTVACILVLVLCIFPEVSQSEGLWMHDARTNCRVAGNPMFAGSTIRWSGNCVEGKAEGAGTLEWFAEGVNYWTETFSEQTGVLLRGGNRVSVLEATQIELKLTECNKRGGYRRVEVHIRPDVDARHWVVISDLLSRAERLAWDTCSAKEAFSNKTKLSNVDVRILQNGKGIARARSYPSTPSGGPHVWQEYSNDLARALVENANRLVEAARAERYKQQMLAQEKAKKEAETRHQAEVAKRRSTFIEKHSVDRWVSAGDLTLNPFQFEGKVVAIQTQLFQMVTSTRGVFSGDIVLSEIPQNKITDQSELIVAGKVLGNIAVKTPLGGEILLPHLEFYGIYFCQERGCRDIVE